MWKLVIGFFAILAVQMVFLGGLTAIKPEILVPLVLVVFLLLPEAAPRRH